MFTDKDLTGRMIITDITQTEAYMLRRAARMLLRKLERQGFEGEKWIPEAPYYRRETAKLSSVNKLRNLITAVNVFFPREREATIRDVEENEDMEEEY